MVLKENHVMAPSYFVSELGTPFIIPWHMPHYYIVNISFQLSIFSLKSEHHCAP